MEAAQSIILDLGTSSVRCGFSGEDLPRSIFPSKLPKAKVSCSSSLREGEGGERFSLSRRRL